MALRELAALLTVEQAARFLGVSRRTLWSRIAAGSIRVVRLGGRVVRIDPEDLRKYIEANKTE